MKRDPSRKTVAEQFATSHEMWASFSNIEKMKLRRENRGLTDNGIRNRLWRRRYWIPVLPDEPCNCSGKLHIHGCANSNTDQ